MMNIKYLILIKIFVIKKKEPFKESNHNNNMGNPDVKVNDAV